MMRSRINTYTLVMAGIIFFLSAIALALNLLVYHYPGNNYFPANTLLIGINIVLINVGIMIIYNKGTYPRAAVQELFFFYCMMATIALATNAVQLTPFTPIDQYLIDFEAKLGITMPSILVWTAAHPSFKYVLKVIYDSLPYQMSIIPLCLIALGRFNRLRNYYFLMFFTVLFGFIFYYFFPTIAPASMINSPFFQSEQIATGLKFKQIHQLIPPTTIEGGLIAMPSFHTIWAILCVYLLKDWFVAYVMLAAINLLLLLSCVLLGWHYLSDVLIGILLAFFSIAVVSHLQKRS